MNLTPEAIARAVLVNLLSTVNIGNLVTRDSGDGETVYANHEVIDVDGYCVELTDDIYSAFAIDRQYVDKDEEVLQELFLKPAAAQLAEMINEIFEETADRELNHTIDTNKLTLGEGLSLVHNTFDGLGFSSNGRSLAFVPAIKSEVINTVGLIPTAVPGQLKLGSFHNAQTFIVPLAKNYAINESAVIMATRRIKPYLDTANFAYLEAGGISILAEVDDSDSASVKVVIRMLLGFEIANPSGVAVIARELAPKGGVLTPATP